MKGHVGGGPGQRQPLGVVRPAKSSRSMDRRLKLGFGGWFYMSRYISTAICDVQERLPEMPASFPGFFGCVVGHKLESLILAQNERWRHA